MSKKINIGMIGLGTVGTGVYKILTEQRQLLEARLGLALHLKKIVVRDPKKKREVNPAKELLSSNVKDILDDPEISLVIEVMGGADNDYPRQALEKGKHVIPANKALLAERGGALFKLAAERGHGGELCGEQSAADPWHHQWDSQLHFVADDGAGGEL